MKCPGAVSQLGVNQSERGRKPDRENKKTERREREVNKGLYELVGEEEEEGQAGLVPQEEGNYCQPVVRCPCP